MNALAFSTLPLAPAQLVNLEQLGYRQMTAIQAAALPLALAGSDIIARAKTGSGKTAAFSLPLLDKLNPRDFATQALILCPTRELATQVAGEVRRLARYQQNIKVVILCGGVSIGPQIGSLEHGAHIVVGTPGRIRDHLRKSTLTLQRAATVVLDEADRMLDMGFAEDLTAIIEATSSSRQTLLFSATYPDDIVALSARFQTEAVEVRVESLHDEQQIDQRFFICQPADRPAALATLLGHFRPAGAVIFCNTKEVVRAVCKTLNESGISALALHGDLEQRDRDQVLVQFRHQSARILVATDVAARGIDIAALPAVINYDLPRDPDSYLHRIGRTGRAGENGLALSLLTEREQYKLDAIIESQQRTLSVEAIKALTTDGSTMAPPAFVTLAIKGGRKHKIRPGDILGALTGDAGIPGAAVGKIDVMEYAAFVAIAQQQAGRALDRLSAGKIKGRNFKVRKLDARAL